MEGAGDGLAVSGGDGKGHVGLRHALALTLQVVPHQGDAVGQLAGHLLDGKVVLLLLGQPPAELVAHAVVPGLRVAVFVGIGLGGYAEHIVHRVGIIGGQHRLNNSGLGGGVIADGLAKGLTDGPDGHIGGAVVGKYIHFLAVDVGGHKGLAVDGQLHAGVDGDVDQITGGQGGGAGAQHQGQGQGGNAGLFLHRDTSFRELRVLQAETSIPQYCKKVVCTHAHLRWNRYWG